MQEWHVGDTLFDARESPKIDDFFDLERNGVYSGWCILFSPYLRKIPILTSIFFKGVETTKQYRYCEEWCLNNSKPHFEVFNSKKLPMKNGKTCKPPEELVRVRSLFSSFSLAKNFKTSGVILTWNPPFGFMRFPFVIR